MTAVRTVHGIPDDVVSLAIIHREDVEFCPFIYLGMLCEPNLPHGHDQGIALDGEFGMRTFCPICHDLIYSVINTNADMKGAGIIAAKAILQAEIAQDQVMAHYESRHSQ